jgi:hypothetical protein
MTISDKNGDFACKSAVFWYNTHPKIEYRILNNECRIQNTEGRGWQI